MMTNALRAVKAMGISIQVLEYDYDEDDLSAKAVADKLGLEPDRVFKTLVAVGDKSGPLMCVVPGSAELDLKKAAKASGNKALAMLPLKELEPLTGYLRGGCSPVGSKKRMPVYVDETATIWESIAVSAGARGIQMIVEPDDLIRACQGSYADIAGYSVP